MGTIIGIDLGTTNSLVAVIEGNKPTIIANCFGQQLLRSVVKITPEGEYLVGEAALRGRVLDPANTITSIKRFIGRKYHEVFDLVSKFAFAVTVGPNNLACIEAHGSLYTPQVISAIILRSLKESAESFLGEAVTEAVITVPAYFNESQKKATREAAELAGLKVRRIVAEPTAAALAYGLDKTHLDMKVAVFDLGGGTFDISILELGDGVYEVKSVSGDGFLGGDDFDRALEKWIMVEINEHYGVSVEEEYAALPRIKEAAHQVKLALSTEHKTTIDIPFLPLRDQPPINVSLEITRTRFEEVCEELFEKLIPPCQEAMHQAGITWSAIDKVILVGGATRMPKIEEIIWKVFQRKPTRSINPDEAVALGAAIQGGVLQGAIKDVLLLDVIVKPLGIEDAEGIMHRFIDVNTTIPTRKSEIFSTCENQQSSVQLNILEGDKLMALDNRSIGHLILENIALQPAGKAEIEVTFEIDANSILHVTARDRASGRDARIRVDVASGLPAEQKKNGIAPVVDRRPGYFS